MGILMRNRISDGLKVSRHRLLYAGEKKKAIEHLNPPHPPELVIKITNTNERQIYTQCPQIGHHITHLVCRERQGLPNPVMGKHVANTARGPFALKCWQEGRLGGSAG